MTTHEHDTLSLLVLHDDPVLLGGIARVLNAVTLDLPDTTLDLAVRAVPLAPGADVVSAVRDAAPDVLVMDYALPGTNAADVLGELTRLPEPPVTLVLLAGASVETAAEVARQGAFQVLPKPFTPADLKHAVRQAGQRILLVRRARRLEAEKKQVRFDFIRVLGHELKAPLGAVATNIGLIKGHYLGDGIASYDDLLQRCELRLDQMHKLIVDLLDMTRLESGQKRRELAVVDLRQAAEDALELAAPQAGQREITLHLEAPDTLPFRADRGEIDMILNNLVSNAVKYNRDGGEVFVTLAPGDDGVTLRVRDTGIGMAPEDVKKLFGEFVRIKNKQTANILGSGLGLSILKRLADLYDGAITVDSVPDEGSTFTVRLTEPAPAAGAAEARED